MKRELTDRDTEDRRTGMRVLIVDDDIAITEAISGSLNWEKLGISEIETAYSADRAKKILKELGADIIICDIEMPKETGLDLLKWYREENMDGQFLFLTSHESFYYATEAITLHAEEYLMKPFKVDMMELVLQKLIRSLKQERELIRGSEYGRWVIGNMREVKLAFWSNLLAGRILNEQENIIRELRKRKIDFAMEKTCRLVISSVTNMEQDISTYGRSMVQFILENLHSELLCGEPENDSVVYFEHKSDCAFVAICEEQAEGELKEKCRRLIKKCESLLSSTVTCCISVPCGVSDFYEVYHRNLDILSRNIVYYGDVFTEKEAFEYSIQGVPVMQLKVMEEYLEKRDKKGFMDYLKKELEGKEKQRVLNGEMLKSIQQEVQQAVYAYLARKGIQISLLLDDSVSVRLSEKAGQSVLDMMRWENYLLGRAFAYEEEVQKSQTIIEKINEYIHEHYKENIGRNEIGAAFFLVPEYLAKMYKKKTGQNLKDYINGYRLQQAKRLLNSQEMKVSDVASEVGFDNFSYFSTLFKKEYDMTPNEYRKSRSG